MDKKFGFDNPRCAVSFRRIGVGQMDSKQEFFAPSDVQVSLQCAMLKSSAAWTRSMTKVSVQLLVRQKLFTTSAPSQEARKAFLPR